MSRKLMLPILFGVCLCLATAAALAAPVSNDQPATSSGNTIRTTLQSDLTLKSTISPELLSEVAFHHKTCHCSCGFPCNQDDDCGPGGRCEQFISCCDQNQSSQAFQQIEARSTHTGEAPTVAVNVKCK
jgi:hypothetical protein